MKWKILIVFLAIFIVGCATVEVEQEEPTIIDDESPSEVDDSEELIMDENEESTEEETIAQNGEVRQVTVRGGSFYFEPNLIEVEVGETLEIVFENDGGVHDLVIPSLGIGTSIINTGESESFTYTFNEAGTFDFECSVGSHAANGMVGRVIVS
ncbi:MAG: plastocyanin/azurin family copper-binding protein [Candidatus Woesearchaeota archaeon]